MYDELAPPTQMKRSWREKTHGGLVASRHIHDATESSGLRVQTRGLVEGCETTVTEASEQTKRKLRDDHSCDAQIL